MSDDPTQPSDAVQQEKEMREHERQARERDSAERSGGPLDDELGTPDDDANPAPPGNIQGGNLGGAS